MHDQNGPFLSAAAIRRILRIHPFSEANRTYLLAEAERREAWEQDVAGLLRGLQSSCGDAVATPVAGTEVTPSFS
ncbi:MAG: hypothetical protein GX774_02360 [Armatimonadetes bacterium]|jgi:hypothetical protein|nr:hypothetical protein [Armatimonadota bacterium]